MDVALHYRKADEPARRGEWRDVAWSAARGHETAAAWSRLAGPRRVFRRPCRRARPAWPALLDRLVGGDARCLGPLVLRRPHPRADLRMDHRRLSRRGLG